MTRENTVKLLSAMVDAAPLHEGDWSELEGLARSAIAVCKGDEEDWYRREHFPQFEADDAAFIAAANPATILKLIASARSAPPPSVEVFGSSPDGDTHRAADGAVVAASPLEIAYGCLWRTITDDPSLRGIRSRLLLAVGKEGQRRGVAWAVANLPEATDAEITRLDL